MLNSGPSTNLVDYLVELDRLNDAHKYFKQIHAEDELKRSVVLYNIAIQKLIEESDRLIVHYSTPINPDELIEVCKSTTYEPVSAEDVQVSDLSMFRIIFDWFKEHGYQQGLLDRYATKRGSMICESIKLLAGHLGQKSVRRVSINMFTVNPRLSTPRRSFNSDMIREHVKAQLTRLGRRIARSPVFSGQDTPSPPSRRNSLLAVPKTNEEADFDRLFSSMRFANDREANRYKYLLDAMVILLLRETDLLFYVFSNEYKSLVLNKLIEVPLTFLYTEAQQLCTAIEESENKIYDGKFAFYALVSIIRWFHNSKPLLVKFYKENDMKLPQQQFTYTLLPIFEDSLIKYLRLTLDEIQNDSSPLSPGGQVHPLTIHVLDYMEDYLSYEDTVIKAYHNRSDTTTQSCVHLADLYRVLCTNIFEKKHDDTIIRAIFLINNTNYILKRIEKSSLSSVVGKIHSNLKMNTENHIGKSIKIYMKCCSPIVNAIQQMFHYDDQHHLTNHQLRDCDRDQLKRNFLIVNSAIDAFQQQHQEYIIDDVQLRDQLKSEIKKTILDIFTEYHSKFASKHFTHNPEKYVRYTPAILEHLIEQLFEN
ncbi:unnamed protein product [Adineta ricciae]|uniref:Exocyst complex component 7 n=1 Tax=Adineta ricciae TaxID=249248 RepID=A0A814Y494_ADIRI|nr:unnamed protein product [Adineta ricciae]